MSAYRVREHNNTSKTGKIGAKIHFENKSEMKQNTNDARTSERLLDGEHTNSGRAGYLQVSAARTKQHEREGDRGKSL